MRVEFLDLKRQYACIKNEIDSAVLRVVESQNGIDGEEVELLEQEVAKLCGVKYAVGMSSGTDALLIALKAIGCKKVVTTPFSFHSTVSACLLAGLNVEFVDIDSNFLIDTESISDLVWNNKDYCVLLVHLYGKMIDMSRSPISFELLQERCFIVEDACQAIGATDVNGIKPGQKSDITCLSFYPTKNLGALGDAGMCVTNNKELYNKMQILKYHGLGKVLGYNARLDEIQAAILRVKLPYLEEWNERRVLHALIYDKGLKGAGDLQLPLISKGHTFHQYTIRTKKRDELEKFLSSEEVETRIYYPSPIHKMNFVKPTLSHLPRLREAERTAEEVLCLPIYPELKMDEQLYVIDKICTFFKR